MMDIQKATAFVHIQSRLVKRTVRAFAMEDNGTYKLRLPKIAYSHLPRKLYVLTIYLVE